MCIHEGPGLLNCVNVTPLALMDLRLAIMEGNAVSGGEDMLEGDERSATPEGPLDGLGREVGLLGRHVHRGDPGEAMLARLVAIDDARVRDVCSQVRGPGFLSTHWMNKID